MTRPTRAARALADQTTGNQDYDNRCVERALYSKSRPYIPSLCVA
jgi:hypothetical protein